MKEFVLLLLMLCAVIPFAAEYSAPLFPKQV